jgi:hypothetical protein
MIHHTPHLPELASSGDRKGPKTAPISVQPAGEKIDKNAGSMALENHFRLQFFILRNQPLTGVAFLSVERLIGGNMLQKCRAAAPEDWYPFENFRSPPVVKTK